jgi:rhodanese-related sulfurtransferase
MEANEWNRIKRSVRLRFPYAHWITTEALATWLTDPDRPLPILLDVRTREEWNVSHLPGARLIDPQANPDMVLRYIAKDTPLVVYSSIGHRSAVFGARARDLGFKNVVVLEGSIFQWGNERRPLISEDGSRAAKVHPYNPFWVELLDDEVCAPFYQTQAV